MALQIRRGTDAQWDINKLSIVAGEPVIATDTGRFFMGTAPGEFIEMASLHKDDYLELANLLAVPYSSSDTYYEGQFATHDGQIYAAKQDISTAEAWTDAHWDYVGYVE